MENCKLNKCISMWIIDAKTNNKYIGAHISFFVVLITTNGLCVAISLYANVQLKNMTWATTKMCEAINSEQEILIDHIEIIRKRKCCWSGR